MQRQRGGGVQRFCSSSCRKLANQARKMLEARNRAEPERDGDPGAAPATTPPAPGNAAETLRFDACPDKCSPSVLLG